MELVSTASKKLAREFPVAKKATLDTSKIPPNCLNLIQQIVSNYPDFVFYTGRKFAYRPNRKKTIILGPPQPYFALQTLHELAHALCGHKDVSTGVLRLKVEREAWERARTLFSKYQNLCPDSWNEDFIEVSLDTYRDWLHSLARCPDCGLTRFQGDDGVFHCPYCENFR